MNVGSTGRPLLGFVTQQLAAADVLLCQPAAVPSTRPPFSPLLLSLSPLPPLSYGRNLAIYLSEWDKKLGRARVRSRALQFEIVEIAQLFSIRASPSPSHEDNRGVGRCRSGAMA